MDSVTQMALGAAVGGVVMGRKEGPKALIYGAICGTLPDLDSFIRLATPVHDFTYHRGYSHSLFALTLLSPLLAWLLSRLHRHSSFGRWFMFVWLCLVTHPVLDCFTVYGTQILLPFYEYPVSWSTIFIIDPVYTLCLLGCIGVGLARRHHDPANLAGACRTGLILSSAYLCLSIGIKLHVDRIAAQSLAGHDSPVYRYQTTPAPFNLVLWRIVAVSSDHYLEGYYSLLDKAPTVQFKRFPSEYKLLDGVAGIWSIDRLKWFTHGLYRIRRNGDRITMGDLRMGGLDKLVFDFTVARSDGSTLSAVSPRQERPQRPFSLLPGLMRRIVDEKTQLW